MTPELENEIISIAPYMYRYKGCDDPKQSLLYFGFECDDGWGELLKQLTKELKDLDATKELKVLQIKEKFGTLRVYLNHYSDEAFKIINKYDRLSETTCEVCGKEGKITGKNWVKTLCNECYTQQEESKNG